MNIQSLRFKAVSHLPQGELVQYLSIINSNPANQNRYAANLNQKEDDHKQQNFVGTPETNFINRNSMQRPKRDSIIRQFAPENENVSKLKQECTKLRFQKMALQTSMQKLKQQLARKDQIIHKLNVQIQGNNNYVSSGSHVVHHNHNLQNAPGLRHTITPIY